MLMRIYKKINHGIRLHGFFYFFKLQFTERFYRNKFKKTSVDYREGKVTAEVLNNISANNDAKINQASPYYEIKKAFSFIDINYSDICLLDIGCGFGKVLNWGMIFNFKEVTGVDLDKSAISKTIDNCNNVQKRGYTTKFNVIQHDAATYNIPEGINVIYIANSFGKITMGQVLENISKYFFQQKKDLYIVYYKPTCPELFSEIGNCDKVYESFNKNKQMAELSIFKFSKVYLFV